MTLLGHDAAWREWRAAIGQGRMHHGWILAGRKGMGKAAFAAAAARELLEAGGSTWSDPRNHPDILELQPLPDGDEEERKRSEGKPFKVKRNIAVDQVRALQRRLNARPTLGERRVVVVDAADDLEKGAANALLKSLEEPPAGTIFCWSHTASDASRPQSAHAVGCCAFPSLAMRKLARCSTLLAAD
ncbi:hypothetical protein [Novosphingobium sp. Gsoil 351]|uniref:hypothetical protein n=1 Tax=Novosphingobium sp. Gsoil 351 TaxID=2675225 RepID=UPI00351AE637